MRKMGNSRKSYLRKAKVNKIMPGNQLRGKKLTDNCSSMGKKYFDEAN